MSSRPNGFTLLELLVALVIFSLLLVGLTQGVHFGLLASRSEARIGGENGGLSEVDLTLRHLIEAMDPEWDNGDRPPLLGGRHAMMFVTDLPGLPTTGAVTASLRPRHVEATLLVDRQHRLILRWQPVPGADPANPLSPPVETELLGGVSHMDLAFWQPTSGWVGGWQSSDLPAMIRIHLVFANRRARRWPDIVVAPVLDRR